MDLKNKTVKCRKQYDCNWCGEKIAEGAKAQYRAGIWDGEFTTEYLHPECWEAMKGSDDLSAGYFPHQQIRGKTLEDSHAVDQS